MKEMRASVECRAPVFVVPAFEIAHHPRNHVVEQSPGPARKSNCSSILLYRKPGGPWLFLSSRGSSAVYKTKEHH